LAALVAGLRTAAADAVPHVLETTRMTPAGSANPLDLGTVYVVDRARWAQANAQVMATMTRPAERARKVAGSPAAQLAGAAEVGGLLAVLSARVLGQFDPYAATADAIEQEPGQPGQPGELGTSAPSARGRLLLVAPNVLAAERGMGVDPADFRLWVCLHEQTHALQFAAAPWLAPHLAERIGGLLGDLLDASEALAEAPWYEKLRASGRTLADLVTGFGGSGPAPFERLLPAQQRAELTAITAVMALLEGHADVMMDAVGPAVVPSVGKIRAKFEGRRDGSGRPWFDAILRRLIGMDAKLAQYRDGAKFVRGVEELVGLDGLNAVWTSPDALPTGWEIADAPAWVRRVHG
jgi:coenzyme F420 biosynthesis associated uncharacterized protein